MRSLVLAPIFLALVCGCGSRRNVFEDAGDDAGDNPFPDIDSGIMTGDASGDGGTGPVDKCHVPPDNTSGNAPMCKMPAAPPNSFNPVIKWKWDDPLKGSGSIGVWTIPLVANMTD